MIVVLPDYNNNSEWWSGMLTLSLAEQRYRRPSFPTPTGFHKPKRRPRELPLEAIPTWRISYPVAVRYVLGLCRREETLGDTKAKELQKGNCGYLYYSHNVAAAYYFALNYP